MSNVIEKIHEKAKKNPKRIVFPEGGDIRVKEAVEYIKTNKIAYPIVIDRDNIDPAKRDKFAEIYQELKKHKNYTIEQAREIMSEPLYYGAMLIRTGQADGFVGGAVETTANVLKASINCLDIDKDIGLITSCFLMSLDSKYAPDGFLVYADCGVIPQPSPSQLSRIAIAAAKFTRDLLDVKPRVALLSFSTKGSAVTRCVEKTQEAVALAQNNELGFDIDGELQVDAALVPEVAKKKLKDSKVAGAANVLIFPNLEAGNIAYKLTERLACARALGPLILGTVQPCSDLSRGCNAQDIIDCTAVTVVRAQKTGASE
ncbi:MAG: phosphate acyltransferase [Candidatus Omnitrophica bacterium]|nr:phosphate acyltransferase [Candidatus Omnitrophota bacterium]